MRMLIFHVGLKYLKYTSGHNLNYIHMTENHKNYETRMQRLTL